MKLPKYLLDYEKYEVTLYTETAQIVLNRSFFEFAGAMHHVFSEPRETPQILELQKAFYFNTIKLKESLEHQLSVIDDKIHEMNCDMSFAYRTPKVNRLIVSPKSAVATLHLKAIMVMDNIISRTNILAKNGHITSEYRQKRITYLRRRCIRFSNRIIYTFNEEKQKLLTHPADRHRHHIKQL